MERQIAYDKLAREDRFVRMRAREVAEIKIDQGLPPFPDLLSPRVHQGARPRHHGRRAAGHGGRRPHASTTFPDAPWEFTMDMARQVWDESRHVEIYIRLLEHLGGYIGEFPETTILWRCACAEDAAARVAGVNRGLEGLACDVFNQLVYIARKMGDPILERAVDFVLADEITHVRMGSKWLTRLTEGDPERRRTAIEFQETIDERFNLGGIRRDRRPRGGADLHRHRGPRSSPASPTRRSSGSSRRRSAPPSTDRPGSVARMTADPAVRGTSQADDSAGRVRHYRYAVERMTRIMAGWIALTPELSAKLLLGRHVWDNAQHADAWGKRLPELRAARPGVRAGQRRGFVAFMDAIEAPEAPGQSARARWPGSTACSSRICSPSTQAHLASANPVYEPPTCRILARCIEDERRHIAAGRDHPAPSPRARPSSPSARVAAGEARLWALLEAAGGVTGQGAASRARSRRRGRDAPLSRRRARVHPPRASPARRGPIAEELERGDRAPSATPSSPATGAARCWLGTSTSRPTRTSLLAAHGRGLARHRDGRLRQARRATAS